MQYGVEIFPYQRTVKADKGVKKKSIDINMISKICMCFVSSFLISRVLLINLMAPFGIGFLVAIAIMRKNNLTLASGCGALLGYFTVYKNLEYPGAYFTIIASVVIIAYVTQNLSKMYKLIISFSLIFIEFTCYKIFMSNLVPGIAVSISFFETLCIYPIYYIISYSITCFNDIKTRHLFTNEELISMAITISLMISGSWGINIYNISIRNILALALVLIISYIKGTSVGAACGVAIGVIVGISSNNMIIYVSAFGVCGIVVGIFKENGKFMSALAYMIAFSIIVLYSKYNGEIKIIEALVALSIFMIFPQKVLNAMTVELDFNKKQEYLNESYGSKIKNILVRKLNSFSGVLSNMSDVLENLVDNEKLNMKSKSSSLVENLADRVCGNCNMNCICWKREAYFTYAAFEELIQNFQEKKNTIPNEIERKCLMRTALIKNTEDIVNNYIINEMWRNRLNEGRELLVSQINNMAYSIGEIVEEFNASVKFNSEIENLVARILNKKRIKYKDIVCYNDKNDRTIIKLSMEACGGSQVCVKDILPPLNEVLKKNMCISDDGCTIDPSDKTCSITFEETPKYHVASYVGRQCKDGEKYNGDSYYFEKLNDGTYMTILSDGMGSGPQAGEESKAVVELIEKFAKAGFSRATAINTVNSIMTLKFSADEKFSTVDLSNIDLYSGEVDFMKVGAVPSFIKSGKHVEVIQSRTLPIGVLDKADVDVVKKQVENGDIIIMLSDGMLDYSNDATGKIDWILEYLEQTNNCNPKELAEELIKKVKELSAGKIKDDMSVIVSKVYSLY